MPCRSRFYALALGIACSAQVATAEAVDSGEPPAKTLPPDVRLAEKYAAEAFDAYGRAEYARAIALYEKALAAAPSPDISYNIARIYDLGLRAREGAIEWYRRYVAEGDAGSSRVDKARQRIAELLAAPEEQPGSGASTPAPGGLAARGMQDAIPVPAPGPAKRGSATHAATDGTSGGWAPLEVSGVVAGSVGLLAVGLGVGFGVAAHAERDTWRHYCNGNECSSSRGVEAAESAERKADVATLAFVSGGALIAIGTTLWVLGAEPEQPTTTARLRLLPAAASSELGCTLSGTF